MNIDIIKTNYREIFKSEPIEIRNIDDIFTIGNHRWNALVSRDMFLKILERLFDNSGVHVKCDRDKVYIIDNDKEISHLYIPQCSSVAFYIIILNKEVLIRVMYSGSKNMQNIDIYTE